VLILYLTDRLSTRGGADNHLLQVVEAAQGWGDEVVVGVGRRQRGVSLPLGTTGVVIKGLGATEASTQRLSTLPQLLKRADVVHIQNVMNPVALEMAVASGRAVVTVQDHRVFCPGPGRTLPDGSLCHRMMDTAACAECLPDGAYRRQMVELTAARGNALRGARLLVLSRYMADELAAAGLPGAEVLPPWVDVMAGPVVPGHGFILGGRLVAHKGVMAAYEAWQHAGTGQPLLLAGDGKLTEQLGRAEGLGWLDRDRLGVVLGNARALLFPSFWQEPFGILGVEALAAGTPVIVASSGGTAEWSDAGCLRVAPGDHFAMVEAICLLADDPLLASRLGAEGRAMAAARFARGPIEARLRQIYCEVAAGPN
jgi:glycosyltransferase involved in cell wall biosynthesis